MVEKTDVKVKVIKMEKLRRVVNVFDAENQDILPEIPDALRKERNVPSVTRKGHFAVVCKTKSKDHGRPRLCFVEEEDEYAFTVKETLEIELSEESRSITTFVTHKGLFRYKRLMFGISSAPEKYQQVIQQVLQDCSGTANISDDIMIFDGSDQAEHDKRLEKVLTRLEERGLTLNKEKCVFDMPKLTFCQTVVLVLQKKRLSGRGSSRAAECNRSEEFLGLGEFQCKIYSRSRNCCRANETIDEARSTICFWS
jgi:hypothetical protein